MDNGEKYTRCFNAETIENNLGNLRCIVYGRNVESCEDCALSMLLRPEMLRKRGGDDDERR